MLDKLSWFPEEGTIDKKTWARVIVLEITMQHLVQGKKFQLLSLTTGLWLMTLFRIFSCFQDLVLLNSACLDTVSVLSYPSFLW